MSNDLLIKINADAKNATKAFDDIKSKTEDLENTLGKVALVSGAAFAAFTAEIFFSVKAFEEASVAAVQLTNALQNQGIYTKELTDDYKAYAVAVQAATGIDDDAVTKAQAVAQTYLGQTKITEELTFAIADLSATMGGDLSGAAEKIARTIGTGTNAFARQGLVISDAATEAERYTKVLEFVQAKAGGLAAEFNKADGYTKALGTSFGNLQEEIGSRFAPIVAGARKALASFFDAISQNPILVDIIASLVTAGAVVAGLAAAVAAAVPVFLTLSAAATAFGVALNVAFVGIPLIIAGVVAAITLLALNWDKSMAFIKSVASGVVTFLSEAFSGLSKILSGAFEFDIEKIKAGLSQVADAYSKGKEDAVATYSAITESQKAEIVKQDEAKKAQADKEAAREAQHQANLRAIRKAELDLLKLQNDEASKSLIDLKSKEIETLKALDQQKTEAELTLYRERYEKIKALQEQQQSEDLDRQIAFTQILADTKSELDAKGIETAAQLRDAQIAQLQATAKTEDDIDRDVQASIISRRIATRNQELLDRKKFGDTTATLNKIMNSDEVKGAKDAADGLVALTQSKNAQLKEIGKVAAIAQISITTPEAAMKAYNSLVGIPFVGPALAFTAAAATVAYGAERIATVTALADGGIVTGGVAGKDSVPAMLMPGELVVPKRNFNDVVGAVRGQNEGTNNGEMLDLLRSIDSKFSQPSQTIINGDVTTDDNYVQALIKKISNALEFDNAKIYGVNI